LNGLADELDEDQKALVGVVWEVFAQHGEFPKFFFVEHALRTRDRRLDAATILKSFPSVGGVGIRAYRAVGWGGEGWAHAEQNGDVWLNLAGLLHVHDNPLKDAICRGLLAFMREATRAQDAILTSPFSLPEISVDMTKVTQEEGIGEKYVPYMSVIADREWLAFGSFQKTIGTGRLGFLTSADFNTLDEYVEAVTEALTVPPPPTTMALSEPRALLRALNFLDVTAELVLGHSLVNRPPMDRSALLAQEATNENDFVNGMAVLTEVLRDLRVPGRTPSFAVGRLKAYLARELPTIDQAAVERATELLDQIRIVRNSSIHPKPDTRLLEAHHALGLPFPVQDFTAAWDSVRGHAEQAILRLQEEIQSARTSPDDQSEAGPAA
jgi:hypothetical protein